MREHRKRARRVVVAGWVALAAAGWCLAVAPAAMGGLFDTGTSLTGDIAQDDYFGGAVGVSGDHVIVGCYCDDDEGQNSGSVYIFGRNQGGSGAWGRVAKVTGIPGRNGIWFGFSVAMSGNTAVVGAPKDWYSVEAGSAFILDRNQGGADNWGKVVQLFPDTPHLGEDFGYSVSASNDLAIIGSPGDDDNVGDSGSAYIFGRNQGGANNWGQVAKLHASDPTVNGDFGMRVGIGGDYAIVGTPYDDAPGGDAGSAYVYARNQGGPDNWGQVTKLTAPDPAEYDYFGHSVAISGDIAAVGVSQDDDLGTNTGSVCIFGRDVGGPDNWGLIKKLTAATTGGARFGYDVSLDDDLLIVGARQEDLSTDYEDQEVGAAYIFDRNEGGADNWGLIAKLGNPSPDRDDHYGHAVSIDGTTPVVGIREDDPFDVGSAGSAVVYTPEPATIALLAVGGLVALLKRKAESC